jgi:hypothetical protein
MRGQLTNKIQELAKGFLGRGINVTELRLYPYLDYVMKNEQYIDPRRINSDDREVMSRLRNEGYIDYHSETFDDKPMRTYLKLTKEFYDYINQVLWFGYVVDAD